MMFKKCLYLYNSHHPCLFLLRNFELMISNKHSRHIFYLLSPKKTKYLVEKSEVLIKNKLSCVHSTQFILVFHHAIFLYH